MKCRHWPLALVLVFPVAGCVHVKTDPIEVKPIHITVDVNVKVEKALDDFFGDLDQKSTTIATPPPSTSNP
jgi:hypothetical protein